MHCDRRLCEAMFANIFSSFCQVATEARVAFNAFNNSIVPTAPGNHSAASRQVVAKLVPFLQPRNTHTIFALTSSRRNGIASAQGARTPLQRFLLVLSSMSLLLLLLLLLSLLLFVVVVAVAVAVTVTVAVCRNRSRSHSHSHSRSNKDVA